MTSNHDEFGRPIKCDLCRARIRVGGEFYTIPMGVIGEFVLCGVCGPKRGFTEEECWIKTRMKRPPSRPSPGPLFRN